MANSLGTNPIFLDTFAALPLTVWDRGRVKIDHIVWAGYTAATDRVTLTNLDGVQIWDTIGNTDESAIDSGHEIGWVNGIKVTAITDGELMIYIK